MSSIVIIEDHPVMRRGLAAYFAGTGRWQVLGTAANLEEAREMIRAQTPHVVLLDLQLGKEWGLDIIRWLDGLKATPPAVAVYSAFDDYSNIISAYSMGAKAYICKDTSEAELENALLTMLKTGSFVDRKLKSDLPDATDKLNRFTKREAEVFIMIKKGISNKQIAKTLGLSQRTVANILSCIYDKTGAKSRLDLMKW
jgi:DNA-binding NarL/FixJ family response regulator